LPAIFLSLAFKQMQNLSGKLIAPGQAQYSEPRPFRACLHYIKMEIDELPLLLVVAQQPATAGKGQYDYYHNGDHSDFF